jgi:epoxide hydrolase-like predicted phosphatase
MVKGIIFDLGGVILPNNNEAIMKKFSKLIKADYATLEGMLKEEDENLVLGRRSLKEFLTRVRNRFELELDSASLINLWDKCYVESTPINFEVLNFVKELKKKKYEVSLVTNIYDSTAQINQRRKLFYSFKPVLLSCRVGLAKPDIKIFARAIREMGAEGKDCILIDDKEANILAGKEFGMKTILYKDNKQLFKDLKKAGVSI